MYAIRSYYDINYAWPSAEIAVMGAKGAAGVLYGREAKKAEDPKAFLAEKEQQYQETVSVITSYSIHYTKLYELILHIVSDSLKVFIYPVCNNVKFRA